MFIASASTTVKFHNFPAGDLVYNYQPGTKVDGAIRGISWSKDGNWLCLVPKSGLAEIISVRDQLKLVHTIVDVEDPSSTAFQNTTKKFICFGTKTGQVMIYDIKSKQIKKKFPKAPSSVSHVEFTAKDSHLVAGCLSGEVMLYSNMTNQISAIMKIPRSESVSALRTNSFKRNFVIGGSNEGVVVVWDTNNVNKHKFFLESHKAPVTGLAFSPINSDLIISTGADRQFCCYDIVSHKCIASIPVENNMTAVDFSADGTHFVMASHNGNIYIHDSRKIQEPVVTFEAHKSTIKFIAFQKHDNSNSSCNLIEDKAAPLPHPEQGDAANSDSFGFFLNADAVDNENNSVGGTSVNPTDSVTAAMGLDTSTNAADSFIAEWGVGNTTESIDIEGNHSKTGDVKKWLDSKQDEDAVKSLKITGHDRITEMESKQMSSTPKVVNRLMIDSEEKNTMFSPILSMPKPEQSVDVTKVKEVLGQEMSTMLAELRAEFKFRSTDNMFQMRRMLLDTHMAMVKEFIKLEEQITALREDIGVHAPVDENYLLEENFKLRNHIALLEEKLANRSDY